MLAFALLNGGAMLAALAVATRLGLRAGGHALLLGTLAGYLVLVHTSVLFAGLLGLLTLGGLAMVSAALVLVVLAALRTNAPSWSPPAAAPFTAATLFGPVVAIAAGVAWAWPHLVDGTRLWVWDD